MIIPSHVPKQRRIPMYGIHQAQVVEIIYPDDKKNSNKERLEYKVNINGQDFNNVIDARQSGGIFDYTETVRKPVERQGSKPPENANEYDEKLDGETVLCAFFGGHSDLPVIIGSLPHPLHASYKKATKADGRTHTFEYNGVEFKIDDDGTIHFEIVGKKDHVNSTPDSPVILNTAAVGAKISISGLTGDILIQDPNRNGIELIGGNLVITTSGNTTVNATDVIVNASGNATIDSDGDIILNSANNTPANFIIGLVADGAVNNDPITGAPLTPIGGIKVGE